MKQELRDRWVKALRSGEYRQTDGYLKNDGAYCCLGVLCHLVKDEYPNIIVEGRDDGIDCYELTPEGNPDEYSIEITFPSHILLDKLKLDYEAAKVLAAANDSGEGFLAIADRIERIVDITD